jgi:hypothetical protein
MARPVVGSALVSVVLAELWWSVTTGISRQPPDVAPDLCRRTAHLRSRSGLQDPKRAGVDLSFYLRKVGC